MDTIKITGIERKISRLGLGTMIFAPNKKKLCFSILDTFVANGGTTIDTAEVYGDPEEHGYSEITIGMWLQERGRREDIVLISKGCIPNTCKPIHPDGLDITPAHIHAAISGSLQRLQTDYIDLWFLHRDDESKPIGPIVEALNKEVQQGRIRAFGGSNWSVKRLQAANEYAKKHGLHGMSASSPHFCLAIAQEPYWPNTVVTTEQDKAWFEQTKMPLFAWSSTGRGFFAKGDRNYLDDPNLVRVYYNDDNFEKLKRAEQVGRARELSRIEIAISYIANQTFPVVALAGPETDSQVKSCIRSLETRLSKAELGLSRTQTRLPRVGERGERGGGGR